MEKLPGDIVTDILLRLPTKQIGRMRCVSKFWNFLLHQRFFIKSHLNRSIQNHDHRVFIMCVDIRSLKEFYAVRSAKFPREELISFNNPPFNPTGTLNHCKLIGSVNGLICLSTRSSDPFTIIHIWNPTIASFKTLPPISLSSSLLFHEFKFSLGFGFDVMSDDYKVVKLINGSEPKMGEKSEIFCMRSDSWKEIRDNVPSKVKLIAQDSVFVNGYLYWLAVIDERQEIVLSFDLGAETFSEISLPGDLMGISTRLGSLSGKLVLFSYTPLDSCELWVMEEAQSHSWVIHYVVPSHISERIDHPLGFCWDGEFMLSTRRGHLALCDPKADRFKRFAIIMGENPCSTSTFVDSLVPVG